MFTTKETEQNGDMLILFVHRKNIIDTSVKGDCFILFNFEHKNLSPALQLLRVDLAVVLREPAVDYMAQQQFRQVQETSKFF